MRLNRLCQAEAVKEYLAANPEGRTARVAVPPELTQDPGHLNRPQEFTVFAGTRLIGVNSDHPDRFVNGECLLVTEVDDQGCTVQNEAGKASHLSLELLARCTRLAWALTITNAQSRTIQGRVCLWDLHSPHMSLRHLYSAITRVTSGELLTVMA